VRIRYGPNPSRYTRVELAPGPPFHRKVRGRTGAPRRGFECVVDEEDVGERLSGLVMAGGEEAGVRDVRERAAVDGDRRPPTEVNPAVAVDRKGISRRHGPANRGSAG
jgi:hypothetical protein